MTQYAFTPARQVSSHQCSKLMVATTFSARSRGFSLMETLVVLSLGLIILGIGATHFHLMAGGAEEGAAAMSMRIRRLRVESVATLQALELYPVSTSALMVRRSSACSDSSKEDIKGSIMNLPRGVTLTSTDWKICFSSRGYMEDLSPVEITFLEHSGKKRVLRIYSGGATKLL